MEFFPEHERAPAIIFYEEPNWVQLFYAIKKKTEKIEKMRKCERERDEGLPISPPEEKRVDTRIIFSALILRTFSQRFPVALGRFSW